MPDKRPTGLPQLPEDADAAPLSTVVPPWLLTQKVTVPDRVARYVHRPELTDRTMPAQRRLTVLRASGGFGKTVLLAECCRRLRADSVATAWVSLDERDEPAVLESYVAFACIRAGLRLDDVVERDAFGGSENRVGVVLRAIQASGEPFVLALDELERLSSASVRLLAFLLNRAPANLHVALACRYIPDGLDVAGAILEGRAEMLQSEDLRFSRAEISRFFDLSLSRRALAEEVKRSAGWPLALRMSATAKQDELQQGYDSPHLIANWIESRLFSDFGRGDRDFVLDLGLFDWFDASLLDEVFQTSASARRLESLTPLEGLLEVTTVGATRTWRLHALLRTHCAETRFREDPERFGTVHRRIAQALSRRGELVSAMRHAKDGGDPVQAADIFLHAGGVRLWTRQGVAPFLTANGLLAEEVVRSKPRLGLARCAALTLLGAHDEARALYDKCSSASHRHVDDRFGFNVDECIVRVGIALYGGEPADSHWMKSLARDSARLCRSPRLDAATRGNFEYAQGVLYFLKGEFDAALQHLSVARELVAGTSYLDFYTGLMWGQIDFVRGLPDSAKSRFQRAQRIAKKHFLLDPVATTACAIVGAELALERNPASRTENAPGLRKVLTSRGVPFSFFATALGVLVESQMCEGRTDGALATVEKTLAYLRSNGTTGFVRLTAAAHVSVLTRVGRVTDASHAWREAGLPEDSAGCLDLTAQSWREMETISEARVRLLAATRRHHEARSLVGDMSRTAERRGLRRTQMRALALSVMVENSAGMHDASVAGLLKFLTLLPETSYTLPLVRDQATSTGVLSRFLERYPDSPHRPAACSLLKAMKLGGDRSILLLTDREQQVLQLLAGRRVKQVAADLGLSVHGVRYHLRKLFTKLDVSNRDELLRRAKETGAIPDDR